MTLFEIPIYSMKYEEFNQKWNQKKQEIYRECLHSGYNEEKALSITKDTFVKYDKWRFNQIIGYIVISIMRTDVHFRIYMIDNKRYCFNTHVKHFMNDMHINGAHIYVAGKDDKHIHSEVKQMLDHLIEKHIKKSRYVDRSVFDNLFDRIDIRKMIDEIDL